MLCRRKHCVAESNGAVPVYLNVYDITSANGYAYWIGLGVYHSGVQVHGVEYAFGAHEYSTTGIFEGEPKQSDGFRFRKGVLIGWTKMGAVEVRRVMEELADEYKGNAYHLITKNCNHFCRDACVRLTGKSIPGWVNRLARIGFLCNCVIPASISTAKIRHQLQNNDNNNGNNNKAEDKLLIEEDKKACNASKRFTPPSNSCTSSTSSSSSSAATT